MDPATAARNRQCSTNARTRDALSFLPGNAMANLQQMPPFARPLTRAREFPLHPLLIVAQTWRRRWPDSSWGGPPVSNQEPIAAA
ncbi:MAG: hypothetical protein J0H57_16690, partial [Rhodospirillales bacterium]|nr:hypothetical protein [Rhodospirillales bacterium]